VSKEKKSNRKKRLNYDRRGNRVSYKKMAWPQDILVWTEETWASFLKLITMSTNLVPAPGIAAYKDLQFVFRTVDV
jgi:hypothetical protein